MSFGGTVWWKRLRVKGKNVGGEGDLESGDSGDHASMWNPDTVAVVTGHSGVRDDDVEEFMATLCEDRVLSAAKRS